MFAELLLLLFLSQLPPTENDPPVAPPEQPAGVSFESLGCTCAGGTINAFRCETLPGFEDKEWIHPDATDFGKRAMSLAGAMESLVEGLPADHHLAFQGWADNRPIGVAPKWSEASAECRQKRDEKADISNFDLAYLRACELRRRMPTSLSGRIRLLEPRDFTNVKNRTNVHEDYKGNSYKAVVLFVVFPERRVCPDGNEKREH